MSKAPSPARLEAFSDGVIAVIITVMVLEIKVPHANGWKGLEDLAPGLLIYLLSFSFTGIYWLNHQHLVHRVEAAGHSIQIANLAFLFCLSLLPFSTAYVVDKQLSGFAVALYAALLLAVALSFLALRISIHGHLERKSELRKEDRNGLRAHLLSMAVYVASIVVAFFYPKLALAAIGLLTLTWVIPNLSFHREKASG